MSKIFKKKNILKILFAPGMKWLRHYDRLLSWSVILSFYPSVMPLPFTFRSFSQQALHTFSSNLIYGCGLWIYRLNLWFLAELCPLNLEKNGKFTFQSLSQQPLQTYISCVIYRCVIEMYTGWVQLYSFGPMIFKQTCASWTLKKMKNSQFPPSIFWRDAYI